MRRRIPLMLLLAGAVVTLVIVAWQSQRRESSPVTHAERPGKPGVAASAAGPRPHISPTLFAALATPDLDTPEEDVRPEPGCWQGLGELDGRGSLADLREALRIALKSGDSQLLAYAQDRMIELIGEDAARAFEVLDWAKTSVPPELTIYMEVLKGTPAVQAPEVAASLLDMAQHDASPDHRAAALIGLESQHQLGATGIAALRGIAMEDPIASTAWVAARTLGQVMKEDAARGGDPAPYMRELLDIGRGGPDEAVRSLALEMPSYSEVLLDSDSLAGVAAILRGDPDPLVREMAAHRLSVTEDPAAALSALKLAFEAESSLCVRAAIARFAVRAAGADALPVLAEFARIEPRLAQDYQDFTRLYASGIVDFSRIWLEKPPSIECSHPEEG